METILLLLLLTFSISICAEKPNREKILTEGKLLYRLEKGAWYGTDNFFSNFEHKKNLLGGYLSYETKDGYINTLFYNKNNPEEILVRYKFDKIPQQSPISIDSIDNKAKPIEKDLIALRNDVWNRIVSNEDSLFLFYPNTSFNIIPLITNNEKKVYVLTAPQTTGVELIGNDYLLTYDKKNKLKDKKRLHNSLIELAYISKDKEKSITATVHPHVLSEFIDPTDICTLLLYREFVEWKQHLVISKDYISIFLMDQEQLLIMTLDKWEKLNKSPKKNDLKL